LLAWRAGRQNFISTCKPVTISNWQSSAFKTNSPTSSQGGRSNLDFAGQHRSKLHGTNPLERLNKKVKRRAE
jgi:transposase-like protein